MSVLQQQAFKRLTISYYVHKSLLLLVFALMGFEVILVNAKPILYTQFCLDSPVITHRWCHTLLVDKYEIPTFSVWIIKICAHFGRPAYLTSPLLNILQFYCKIGQFLSQQSLIHDCYRIHVCYREKSCFIKEIEN